MRYQLADLAYGQADFSDQPRRRTFRVNFKPADIRGADRIVVGNNHTFRCFVTPLDLGLPLLFLRFNQVYRWIVAYLSGSFKNEFGDG